MNVSFERVPTFDAIFADADFIALSEEFARERLVRQFVPAVIKRFRRGLHSPDSFTRYAAFWGQQHQTSHPQAVTVIAEAAELLTRLYRTWAQRLDNLRGALVEGLVLAQIRPRYTGHALVDNAVIVLANGQAYRSPTTVDVSGWDGNRGECHDCKVHARRIDLALVQSLETQLPYPEFRIGVVSVDSRPVMAESFSQIGYEPGAHTSVIPLEELWELAPLQRPRSRTN